MNQFNLHRSGRPLSSAAAIALALVAGGSGALKQNWAPPVPSAPALVAESLFLDENAVAMDKMMAGMHVKPAGDVDRDFVAMMRPHHQGAIDMARAYLRYSRNEQLRRIAQEIIVEQQQEIVAMNLAIGDKLSQLAPEPTEIAPRQSTAAASSGASHGHTGPTGRAGP